MYRKKPLQTFLIYHLIAFSFFFSWYCSLTSEFWTQVDKLSFYWLNGSLQNSPLSQLFWALANVKASDLFGAIFMAGFSLLWVFDAPKEGRARRLAEFIYLLIWFEIGILTLKELIFPYLVSINFLRDSPSLVFDSPVMLSNTIDWLKIKDSSRWSFPGDHALIILQWAAFMTMFAGRRLGIIAYISSMFFILPRLVAGAHWVSDALCGSLPLALIIVAWATCTPLYQLVVSRICMLTDRIFHPRKGTLNERLELS